MYPQPPDQRGWARRASQPSRAARWAEASGMAASAVPTYDVTHSSLPPPTSGKSSHRPRSSCAATRNATAALAALAMSASASSEDPRNIDEAPAPLRRHRVRARPEGARHLRRDLVPHFACLSVPDDECTFAFVGIAVELWQAGHVVEVRRARHTEGRAEASKLHGLDIQGGSPAPDHQSLADLHLDLL